jgi:DNA polymerase-3 subunit delta'
VRFSEVVGQDRAIATLRDAVRAGRIHHAWIFHGPAGVGKFTTALAFAGLLLDPTSRTDLSGEIGPDPDSPAQHMIASGTHPDLRIVTKELARVSSKAEVRDRMQTPIPVEVIREFFIEPAERSGSAGGGRAAKVFIIDEAELLDARGQNAILKTLEEPPPGTVLILVTSQEEKLLPTIRSRAQRIAFPSLADADMQRWLKSQGPDLSGLDAQRTRWLLDFADGAPGIARLALETGVVEWPAAIEPLLDELDRGRFPIEFGTATAQLIDEWAEAWVDRPQHENASKEAAKQAASRLMTRLLCRHYRARMRRGGAEAGQGARAVELIREAEQQAESHVSPAFILDNLGARLCAG